MQKETNFVQNTAQSRRNLVVPSDQGNNVFQIRSLWCIHHKIEWNTQTKPFYMCSRWSTIMNITTIVIRCSQTRVKHESQKDEYYLNPMGQGASINSEARIWNTEARTFDSLTRSRISRNCFCLRAVPNGAPPTVVTI